MRRSQRFCLYGRAGNFGRARLWSVLLVALLLAACGAETRTEPGNSNSDGGSGTEWQLQQASGPAGDLRLIESSPITLVVNGDEIRGISACNHYSGKLTEKGDRVEITELGGTEMGCEPPVMELEQAYLAALGAVDQMTRDGDNLVLTGPDVDLRFALVPPVETADLVGTQWLLNTLIEGDVASSTRGEPATLVLAKDGTLRGSTGCSQFSAHYTLAGDAVHVTDWAVTGECPSDLADQERHVSSVLKDGFQASIKGAQLTVSGSGDLGLVYNAE